MTQKGIGYTVVNGTEYRLVTWSVIRGGAGESTRKVDDRFWDLTDEGEKQAADAAKQVAKARKAKYVGEIR